MDWDWDWDKSGEEGVVDVSAGNEVHYWWGRRRLNVAHSCFLGMPWIIIIPLWP